MSSLPLAIKPTVAAHPSFGGSHHDSQSQHGSRSPRSPKSPSSPRSAIWKAALDKYYGELAKGGIKASAIDKDLWNIQSPDELISQISTLEPVQSLQSSIWTKSLSQLQPVLLSLSNFAALSAWVLGLDGKVAAVLWGSIRLIIKVRSNPSDLPRCPTSKYVVGNV